MDRETFTTTIQALQDRRPFKPFMVALVNEDRYEVDRPNSLAVGEGIAILIAPGSVPVFFDHEGVRQVIGDLSGRGPSHPDRAPNQPLHAHSTICLDSITHFSSAWLAEVSTESVSLFVRVRHRGAGSDRSFRLCLRNVGSPRCGISTGRPSQASVPAWPLEPGEILPADVKMPTRSVGVGGGRVAQRRSVIGRTR